MPTRYAVIAKTVSDKHSLIQDLQSQLASSEPGSDLLALFYITSDQAQQLEQDPRVDSVEIYWEDNPYIEITTCNSGSQYGVFNRYTDNNASYVNWGLIRHNLRTDPFTYPSIGGWTVRTNYDYNFDGSDVDVIIIDTGVQADHPEFALNPDGTGGSRVVDYDWAALAARHGITDFPTSQSVNGYLNDYDGHGTQVASVAAGNRQGWAKKASIYTLRCVQLGFAKPFDNPTGPSIGPLPLQQSIQLTKWFHEEKVLAGNTRPTVVNNSWTVNGVLLGNSSPNNPLTSIVYRNTTYNIETFPANAYLFKPLGVVDSRIPTRIASFETDIQSAVASGVIYVGAANNYGYKIDIPNGVDYNNYLTSQNTGSTQWFYHRGSTPGSTPGVISVGALDYDIRNPDNQERKANFSSAGPRVDVYAAGVNVFGAYKLQPSISPALRSSTDDRSPATKSFYLFKLRGTSQASPQVAGVAALIAEANPSWTPAQIRSYIIDTATTGLLTEIEATVQEAAPWAGLPNYSGPTQLFGGPNRLLYSATVGSAPGFKGGLTGTGRLSGAGSLA